MTQTYESKVIDHLGLVATMFDELGLGVMIDQQIPQDCDKRIISIGDAVKVIPAYAGHFGS